MLLLCQIYIYWKYVKCDFLRYMKFIYYFLLMRICLIKKIIKTLTKLAVHFKLQYLPTAQKKKHQTICLTVFVDSEKSNALSGEITSLGNKCLSVET